MTAKQIPMDKWTATRLKKEQAQLAARVIELEKMRENKSFVVRQLNDDIKAAEDLLHDSAIAIEEQA